MLLMWGNRARGAQCMEVEHMVRMGVGGLPSFRYVVDMECCWHRKEGNRACLLRAKAQGTQGN